MLSDHSFPLPDTPLSSRELTCLRWVAIGKTSWEIAAILGVTERTINFHVGRACRKLGVTRRQAAVAMALEKGLLPALYIPRARRQATHPPAPSGKAVSARAGHFPTGISRSPTLPKRLG